MYCHTSWLAAVIAVEYTSLKCLQNNIYRQRSWERKREDEWERENEREGEAVSVLGGKGRAPHMRLWGHSFCPVFSHMSFSPGLKLTTCTVNMTSYNNRHTCVFRTNICSHNTFEYALFARESRAYTLENVCCFNIERHRWIIPCDRQWIQLKVSFFLSLFSYQSHCHTYAHKYMHTLSHLKWCPRESMSYLGTNRSSCPWGMLECVTPNSPGCTAHMHTFTLAAYHTQTIQQWTVGILK